MSGAGHMLYAIKTLKANRNLLKKRALRNKNDFKRKLVGGKLQFKKSTPEQMRAIKTKIKGYKKSDLRLNIILFTTTIIILFLIIWRLIN
tara:strand:+ start:72281 stop:72550 length:270 start_codon:yes stop_codon:yes gene_type:complete